MIFRLVDLIKEGLDDAVASKEEEILVYGVLVSKFSFIGQIKVMSNSTRELIGGSVMGFERAFLEGQ